MSDFIGDRQCVTHHNACDCREEHFKKLETENEKLKCLLKAALCPNVTNGCSDGIMPDPYGQPMRCQWCDEAKEMLEEK